MYQPRMGLPQRLYLIWLSKVIKHFLKAGDQLIGLRLFSLKDCRFRPLKLSSNGLCY